MASHVHEIAKEITLAAIEKGIVIQPTKPGLTKEEISEYNQIRAKELGDFYKSIASSVNDSFKGL